MKRRRLVLFQRTMTEASGTGREAYEKVGKEGVITVEESKTTESALEVVEGTQFDRGYISPYFETDMEKMEAVLEDALVRLHEANLELQDASILEQVVKAGRPLLTAAEDVEGEALATLVVNRSRHASFRCSEGSRTWRPAERNAAGYRDPYRGTVDRLKNLD